MEKYITAKCSPSFICGNPQVIEGPDSFPYFQFPLSTKFAASWVFSYVDLSNCHLNREFYTATHIHNAGTEVLHQNEEVLIAQPSEQFHPKMTRDLLRQLMIQNNIADVKMLLMMRRKAGALAQELVFNLAPDRFQNQEQFDAIMRVLPPGSCLDTIHFAQ